MARLSSRRLRAWARRARSLVAIPFMTGYPFDRDRKSTRLNSSHVSISYAVVCVLVSFPTRRSSDLMCSMSLMWPAGEADPRARGPGELVAHAGVGGVVHGPAEFPTTTRLGATSPQSRGHSVHDWLSLRS